MQQQQVNTDTLYYPKAFSQECTAFARKISFAPEDETIERVESYPSLPRQLRIFLHERLNAYLATSSDNEGSSSVQGKRDTSDAALKKMIREDLLTRLDLASTFDGFMNFNDRVRYRLFECRRKKVLYGVFAFTSRCEGPPRMVRYGFLCYGGGGLTTTTTQKKYAGPRRMHRGGRGRRFGDCGDSFPWEEIPHKEVKCRIRQPDSVWGTLRRRSGEAKS